MSVLSVTVAMAPAETLLAAMSRPPALPLALKRAAASDDAALLTVALILVLLSARTVMPPPVARRLDAVTVAVARLGRSRSMASAMSDPRTVSTALKSTFWLFHPIELKARVIPIPVSPLAMALWMRASRAAELVAMTSIGPAAVVTSVSSRYAVAPAMTRLVANCPPPAKTVPLP